MIALIAHDSKKRELLEVVSNYVDFFISQDVIATGNTGKLLKQELGLDPIIVSHGPHGGDLEIGARVVQGVVQAVIFLRDPLTAQAHEPDIGALMRVCDVHDVALATNKSSALAVLDSIVD